MTTDNKTPPRAWTLGPTQNGTQVMSGPPLLYSKEEYRLIDVIEYAAYEELLKELETVKREGELATACHVQAHFSTWDYERVCNDKNKLQDRLEKAESLLKKSCEELNNINWSGPCPGLELADEIDQYFAEGEK